MSSNILYKGEIMEKIIIYKGKETNYTVSEEGKIFNTKTKRELKGTLARNEYPSVQLRIDGKAISFMVHRLVAEAFCENPNGYTMINHKNGIRDDNRVENLRWCTVKMNANYELAKKNRSEAIKQSYINDPELRVVRANTFGKSNMKRVEVFKNGESLGVFESQVEASKSLGVSQSLISSCMRNGTTSKKGITVKKI